MRSPRSRSRALSSSRPAFKLLSGPIKPVTEQLESRTLFAIITVTGVGDAVGIDGQVTLREAILAANTNAAVADAPAGTVGLDTIQFNIAPAGIKTISPTSPLPAITDTLYIDGFTQPGVVPVGTLKIELRGSLAGAGADGLFIKANNSGVRGLAINRFSGDGIEISGGVNTTIQGNYIGTDRTGTIALGNGGGPAGTGAGINLDSSKNLIGTDGNGVNDAAERNIISGNGIGVRLSGTAAAGNRVSGNGIGVDRTGVAALGNRVGVLLTNGASSNQIGTDGSGATVAERNVISGNKRIVATQPIGGGVQITLKSNNNLVAGNYIGTNAAGTAALANDHGVAIGLGSLANVVGTNGNGVGDQTERNVISGNTLTGVSSEDQSIIAGNYIGVASNGVVALGNGTDGVHLRGQGNLLGTNANGVSDGLERNVIAFNGQNGVLIQNVPGAAAVGNVVAGNSIGVNAANAPAANGLNGVNIVNGFRNRIGGPTPISGNVISYNRADGVSVPSGSSNSILTNSIYKNGYNAGGVWTGGLGIDLGPNGVTLNDGPGDPDVGANTLQNFPIVYSAVTTGATTTIKYQLISTANTKFVIQFFANAAKSLSNYGEGQRYLGSVAVATNAVGATGVLTITFAAVPVGQWITATATSGSLTSPIDTSEFSFARQVV